MNLKQKRMMKELERVRNVLYSETAHYNENVDLFSKHQKEVSEQYMETLKKECFRLLEEISKGV